MPTNFRSEVFKLCKLIQKKEDSIKLGKILYDMSVYVETKNDSKSSNSRNDFSQMAKSSNSEFHGFLFLDDNIDNINIPHFLNVVGLPLESRTFIERGHRTLTRFVELCLADIATESTKVANSMNPYFLYKEVKIPNTTISLLSDNEMIPAVTAFKNGKTYKALMSKRFTKLFNNVDLNSMRLLNITLEKEIGQSLGENVSSDLQDFAIKLHSKLDNVTDVMFAYTVLMMALKMALKISCQSLYKAIYGSNLFVLNNDNIINIEVSKSTIVSEFYKVFSQDLNVDISGSEMGSIVLIDCDLPSNNHLHEFGILIAQTLNLVGEFGESAKYSIVTLNKELIPIHILISEILRGDLPAIN